MVTRWAWALVLAGVMRSAAQTTVTTSGGTANTVPVFTSSSAVTSSPISISGGNVGIGTTAPNAALTIDGNGASAFNQLAIGSGGGSAGNYQLLIDAGSAYAGIQTIQQGVGYNLNLALQPFGGKVGIGIPSPLAPLHIVSGVANPYNLVSWEQGVPADTGTSCFSHRLTSTNGTPGPYGFGGEIAGFLTQGVGGGLTLSTVNGTAPLEVMRLNYNGNVGIGTTSPQALLDVNGGVRISGGGAGLTFPDGTIQATAYTGTCTATGGDYAESVDVTGAREHYEPGDIMVIDPAQPSHFLLSAEPYSTLVAGIYSTKPKLCRTPTSGESYGHFGRSAHGDDRHRSDESHC